LPTDQQKELDDAMGQLLSNQRQAAALFINEDLLQARALANEKGHFRDIEAQAAEQQLARIKAGQVDAADLGALYLDILRDLKSINSHLVGAAAYPLLAKQGELLPSRLRDRTE